MQTTQKDFRFLNSNAIKFIAAISMFIDHMAILFFPYNWTLRMIGRVAMPLFAFAISEGCRYTKDKVKYLSIIFGLGVIFSLVFYFFQGIVYLCIFITFAFSIANIYALQNLKKRIFDGEKWNKLIPAILIFLSTIALTVAVSKIDNVILEHQMWGCFLPVFASLFDFRGMNAPKALQKLDNLTVRVLCMAIGTVIMSFDIVSVNPVAFYTLFAIPILLLYNGQKGKLNTKHFFYVFYPLHLVLLEGIHLLMYNHLY